MPTLSFPTTSVIERLQAIDQVKLVGLAPEMSAALATPPRTAPAVFVVTSTKGGPIKFSGPPLQQERETSLVFVVWVRNHGDAAKVRAELDSVLAAIDQRLAAWSPANPPYGDLQFVASRDEFSHAQYLVAQAIYSCSWNFSAQRQA
ncbi:MAG: phage tail terminator protein [Panacagrimonas sp.]